MNYADDTSTAHEKAALLGMFTNMPPGQTIPIIVYVYASFYPEEDRDTICRTYKAQLHYQEQDNQFMVVASKSSCQEDNYTYEAFADGSMSPYRTFSLVVNYMYRRRWQFDHPELKPVKCNDSYITFPGLCVRAREDLAGR